MAKLFSKILCPIDFDDNSMEALALAAKVAKQSDAILYVMHVVFGPLSGPVQESNKQTIKKMTRKLLEGDLRYEIVIESGDPATAINAAAEKLDVDLVTMATHGRAGVARMFLGSVAEKVVRGSERPVLVVRPKAAAA